MASVSEFFSETGALAKELKDYQPREQQVTMAEVIAETLDEESKVIIEAGTGTGKSLAYLVPAFLSGCKTIISTGTKALQDQLFHKDIPLVKKLIKAPRVVKLLKGRANYLCLHRLELHADEFRFESKQVVSDFNKIRDWAQATKTGDISDAYHVEEDSQVWPYVTSTETNCLGAECPCYKECHLVKARKDALEADIVIVNHHLFFADLVIKQEGFGELLPGADAIIMDEAHQLPEVAAVFFSEKISSRQLNELATDCQLEFLTSASDFKQLQVSIDRFMKAIADMRLAFAAGNEKDAWYKAYQDEKLKKSVDNLTEQLSFLHNLLKEVASRSKGLDSCCKRAEELLVRFLQLTSVSQDPEHIQWYETFTKSFSLHLTPLHVDKKFKEILERQQSAWVFTSATLAIKDSFDYFSRQMGVDDFKTLKLDSPFDYAKQAKLYVPHKLPDPKAQNYIESLIKEISPIFEKTGGRAFLLFTSYQAMYQAKEFLEGSDFELLVQGTTAKRKLLEDFSNTKNALLLATSSFWEGVDVRGDALVCVVIDKLPFASPYEPTMQGRIKALKQSGIDPFADYQIPQAVIALKQGAGRLIRDVADKGVLIIADPRFIGRHYGATFKNSLPPMPLTRSLTTITEFIETESL